MEEAREKKYLEIPLSKILKFRPYRRLLFCIYILFSHDEITVEEIQQKLNSPETFEDFKKLWWISIKYLMEKETLIAFENWKSSVSTMIVEKFNHTRIVSNTSFPILKCNQCLFSIKYLILIHQSFLKSSKVSGLLSFC